MTGDLARLAALSATGLLDSPPDTAFDRLARLASRLLRSEISLISLVADDRQFFKSQVGLNEPWASLRQTSLAHSLCRHVVRQGHRLVIEDATKSMHRDSLAVLELGFVAYAGEPLIDDEGHILGTLCAIERQPRTWSDEELATLNDLAKLVMTEISLTMANKRAREEALQRRRAEGELTARLVADAAAVHARSSTERVVSILEQISDSFVCLDRDWKYIYVNQRTGQSLGREPATLVGKHIWTEFPEGVGQKFHLAYERAMTEQRYLQVEEYYPPYDRWFENRIYPSEDGLAIFFRDVTELRHAAYERERLLSILESTTDLVTIATADGDLVYVNNAGRRLLGLGSDVEVRGMHMTAFRPRDAAVAFQETVLPKAQRDGTWLGEVALATLDGREFPATQMIIWHPASGGRGAHYSTVARDLSADKRVEAALRESQDRLRQAQKMEAIGHLAGGIAHDFNNLLTVIFATSETLLEDYPAGHEKHADAVDLKEASRRAASLTRQLLTFSRKRAFAPSAVDLHAVVTSIEPLLKRLVRADVTLAIALTAAGSVVWSDRSQLEQVVLNLVVNARDAMPTGGTLRIETRAVNSADVPSPSAPTPSATFIALRVIDTGVGIPPEIRDRIFDPFFTTKPTGSGTGLGLSTVYGIVKQSGGELRVESEVGRGTIVTVYLPITDKVEEAPNSTRALAVPRGAETILLVDDDPLVRTATKRILLQCGYSVLEAGYATEALQLVDSRQRTIDLVLTDIVLPGMSGIELVARLSARGVAVPVLFMSGYLRDASFTDLERRPLLEKPFTPSALINKIREVLATVGRRTAVDRSHPIV